MLMIRPFVVAATLLLSAAGTGAAQAQSTPQTPAPPQPTQPGPPKEVQPAESRLQFYGFVRQDLILDDSRPDAAQTPLFILSEPAGAADRASFTMHPRLTRFGININGPELDGVGARIGGRIEIDFQNGGRESRAIPRWRHAYMTLGWGPTTLLIGQTSDLISPLFPAVNGDTLMWNAGNLGDRRPQVRGTYQSAGTKLQCTAAAAIGLTGAVDQQDLDENGVRDGEDAAAPNVQGRFGVSYPLGKRRLAAGVWALTLREQLGTPIAGDTDFSGHALGVDADIPVGSRAVVRGEAWIGSNLSDFRGGIGQGITRATGVEVDSKGGWIEAGYDFTRRYSAFVGYTIDSPDEEDLPVGGRTRNGAWYIVNRFVAGRPFTVGADYLRWTTEYRGAPRGTDNRVNAYVIYNF
jgi:hypothetical protein